MTLVEFLPAAVCRSCSASIVWVVTEASTVLSGGPPKSIPIDPEPDPVLGNVELVVTDVFAGRRVLARVHAQRPLFGGDDMVLFVSHFVSCPDAGSWRKK